LQSRNNKEGVKNNYVSPDEGISYVNEEGETEKLSLAQGIVKAFGQLNTYVTEHNVSDKIFTKACERKGLDSTDIKNIQALRASGKIHETEEDVGILQNILKKVGLTKGLKKDGTPDLLFGSGTVEDTESLCLFLESALGQELEWDNFNDNLDSKSNNAFGQYNIGINDIKATGVYDPEKNDPLKWFDNTLIAEGGHDSVNNGNYMYTLGELVSLPSDVLKKVTTPRLEQLVIKYRGDRKDQVKKWEKFQEENLQYFQNQDLAQQQ